MSVQWSQTIRRVQLQAVRQLMENGAIYLFDEANTCLAKLDLKAALEQQAISIKAHGVAFADGRVDKFTLVTNDGRTLCDGAAGFDPNADLKVGRATLTRGDEIDASDFLVDFD